MNDSIHRERAVMDSIAILAKYYLANAAIAESNFSDKNGFYEAIDAKIMPCVQALTFIEKNKKGTCFYFGSNWISSNSHVVADLKDLEAGSVGDMNFASVVASGFFRPKDLGNYPDVMVANITPGFSSKTIPTSFPEDDCHNDSLTFYIDVYDLDNPVKLLEKTANSTTDPESKGLLVYSQSDGTRPRQGTSGSPIIEARLIITKHNQPPHWVFALQGMLFAYKEDSLHAYAVPLGQDLEQIRSMLILKQEQKQYANLARAKTALGTNPASLWNNAILSESHYNGRLISYMRGEGNCEIILPDNLEPLDGNMIVPLKCSYRVHDKERTPIPTQNSNSNPGSKKHKNNNKKLSSMLKHIKKVTSDELQKEMDDLYTSIEKQKVTRILEPMNSKQHSNIDDTECLRVDILGSTTNGCLMFSLQDNLKGLNNKPLQIDGKSLSSTFAIAKIYTRSNKINTKLIVNMLEQSRKEGKAVKYFNCDKRDYEKSRKGKEQYENDETAYSYDNNNKYTETLDHTQRM